jgi:hypothetical protein
MVPPQTEQGWVVVGLQAFSGSAHWPQLPNESHVCVPQLPQFRLAGGLHSRQGPQAHARSQVSVPEGGQTRTSAGWQTALPGCSHAPHAQLARHVFLPQLPQSCLSSGAQTPLGSVQVPQAQP